MIKFTHVEPDGSIADIENPRMCQFGLTEVAAPLIVGALTDAGVGAATAGTIGSIAAPALVQGGLGAGVGSLFGKTGTGAALGALSGALGPLSKAMGLGSSGSAGALSNTPVSIPGLPGVTAQNGSLQSADGAAGAAGTGATSTSLNAAMPSLSGAGSPLAQTSSSLSGGGLKGALAVLAALAQNANRPSTTAPTGITQNTPFNPTGYINRTQNMNPPAGGSYYTYGQQAQQPFFSGNQLTLAHGGAISRAIACGHYADGGEATFDSDRGDFSVGGHGSGQEDNIDAKLSPGEVVWDAGTVSAVGDGNSEEGARRLMEVRDQIAKDKGFKHNVQPKLKKSPLEYLKDVA